MRHSQTPDLASAPLLPLFARFAIPGAIAMLFMAAQFITDSVIIGRMLGPQALALGLNGIWLAIPATEALTLIATLLCLLRWQRKHR